MDIFAVHQPATLDPIEAPGLQITLQNYTYKMYG